MTKKFNCAHRGASALAPENTLAALELAIRLGATMAEIDIQQTADDRLVLFHDDDLERTSNGAGPLWRHTLEQLKSLDAGSWFSEDYQGEAMPSFEEAVNAVRGRLELNIELKMHGHERDLENLVVAELRKQDCLEWCLVTSFDHAAIDRLAHLEPGLKVGYIVGRNRWHDSLLQSRVQVLSLEKGLVTADRVRQAHVAGKEIHAWTVNEIWEMVSLRSLGVDVLIGNHPERVSALTAGPNFD